MDVAGSWAGAVGGREAGCEVGRDVGWGRATVGCNCTRLLTAPCCCCRICSFGDVFVTRVAGNIVTNEITASLEFGTAVLGSKVLMVLGHSACGAVAATMNGAAVPGVISSLYYRCGCVLRGGGRCCRCIVKRV